MKKFFGDSQSQDYQSTYSRRQVHGVSCVEILAAGQVVGDADGFWTRVPNLKVDVITADCVPILLSRLDGRAVAALHAGWRGTIARIAAHFFKTLPPDFAQPGDWSAHLGPSIRWPCYEVSEELITQFKDEFKSLDPQLIEPEPRRLDLIAVNQFQLESLGLESIEIHPDCTFCARAGDSGYRYRSYRRGDRASRQSSWIFID